MKRIKLICLLILVALVTSGFALCFDSALSQYRINHKLHDRESRFGVLNKPLFCEYKMKLAIYRNDLLDEYNY